MFEYIKGIVTRTVANYVVIDCSGVGYKIYTPNPYKFKEGEESTAYVYNYIREEENVLYGFTTEDERELFLKLISVKGLGPKGALAILASCTSSDIKEAVEASNAKFFVKFPGIGNKLSQQIILDLKGKIDFDSTDNNPNDERIEQISLALKSLGYNNTEIKNVTKKLKLEKDTTISDAIKIALKLLKM